MADEIEPIIDLTGQERRCGSLAPDVGMLRAFAAADTFVPDMDDDQVKKIISDPYRSPSREIFGPSWIQNQFSKGSCNGYATAALQSRVRWSRGIRDKMLFSGAYVYSKINGGRDQGSHLSESLRVIEVTGVCAESLVPWDNIFPGQHPANANTEASKHKGFRCYPVKNLRGLRTALANRWPCVVAVHVGNNFQRLGTGGILGVDSGPGNHAVCVDDLRFVNGRWLYDMANSWGKGFGDNGRGYLTDDHFKQTSTVILLTITGPDGPGDASATVGNIGFAGGAGCGASSAPAIMQQPLSTNKIVSRLISADPRLL